MDERLKQSIKDKKEVLKKNKIVRKNENSRVQKRTGQNKLVD
jgi:hypothetical protein